ncbi:MAG: hypothetical protein RL514_4248 [Verrucomicrobiota bacterium]
MPSRVAEFQRIQFTGHCHAGPDLRLHGGDEGIGLVQRHGTFLQMHFYSLLWLTPVASRTSKHRQPTLCLAP